MTTLLFSALAACLTAPPPAGLTKHHDATWVVRATAYCPGHPRVDPPCGGFSAAWTGQRLKPWHCATDPRYIAYGTKLWAGAPINRLLLAVDCGGAIRGARLDVSCPDPDEYRALAHKLDRDPTILLWKVGSLTRAQARSWKPEVPPCR